jgi:hypothetical protein
MANTPSGPAGLRERPDDQALNASVTAIRFWIGAVAL